LSLFEILNLRYQYEQLAKKFSLPSYESDIDNITWFLNNGHKSNSLRNGYDDAKNIAIIIKEYANGRSEGYRNIRRNDG